MPSIPTYNEAHLLQRLAAGEQDAFRQVFEQYWDQVYAVGLKISKSPELAKDLAQETFMKLWHQRAQLNAVTNFRAYLNVLSRNLAIDHLRKKVFTADNEDYLLNYFHEGAAMLTGDAEYKELEQILSEAVNQLPPQMQQVFRLSRFEGLSHAEIAARMNITLVTSKSYMVRALAAIRKHLSRYQYEPLLFWLFIFSIA
ncbi:MAG: RNA polymerase sigma-70 factor [Sphingobacteriales bacterium]|nr:RNA polymerase sigma-70 factor [Sphingobacteriales bacterium]